jgi:hypothetical protein
MLTVELEHVHAPRLTELRDAALGDRPRRTSLGGKGTCHRLGRGWRGVLPNDAARPLSELGGHRLREAGMLGEHRPDETLLREWTAIYDDGLKSHSCGCIITTNLRTN